VLQIFVQDQGLPFPAALFGLHPNLFFLLTFALSEFQQFGVRNEHTTTDSPYRKLLACDERVQRSFADSNEPSGFRFAVEQNMPVHIDTSGFWLFNFVAACGRAVLKNSPLLGHHQSTEPALFGKQFLAGTCPTTQAVVPSQLSEVANGNSGF
jgi:hypothetical protein